MNIINLEVLAALLGRAPLYLSNPGSALGKMRAIAVLVFVTFLFAAVNGDHDDDDDSGA